MGVYCYPILLRKTQIIAALTMVLFTPPASANPNLNCEVYASEAMAEIAQANSLQCGFGGPAWVADYNAHFNWCKSDGVGIVDVSREDQARKAAIAQCQQANKPLIPLGTLSLSDDICTKFAGDMVALAKDNQTLNCGFSEPRYDDNYQGHFDWCKSGVSLADVNQNRTYTAGQIEQCRAKAASNLVCAFYDGRMNDLYDRFNDSCAGRDGVTQLYPEDHVGQCVAAGGDEQWMNLRESALRDQVEACETLPKQADFVNPRAFGFLIDICEFDEDRFFCGKATAEKFCNWQGYSIMTGYMGDSTSSEKTLRISCFWDTDPRVGNQSITIRPECDCDGDCGYLAYVGCKNP